MLEYHAHFLSVHVDVRIRRGDVLAVEVDAAAAWSLKQIERAEEGGFAGAGRSENNNNLAFMNFGADAAQNMVASKGFFQILYTDHYIIAVHCCVISFPVRRLQRTEP